MQCPNCGSEMDPQVEFCPACGQKNTDGRITFRELLEDLFEAIFNIDSRVFRTMGGLIRPGKLTIDYFKGRQKRYVNPLRLFFVTTLILFGVISYIGRGKINAFVEREISDVGDSALRSGYRDIFLEELDSAVLQVDSMFGNSEESAAVLDSLKAVIKIEQRDSFPVNLTSFPDWGEMENETIQVATEDLVKYDIEDIPARYGVNNWFEALVMRQQLKLVSQPGSFTLFLFGSFTWMVLLMMPAVGLVLKLLYIRRRKFYIEHLVFLFHYHSFAFLLLAVGLLLSQYWSALFGWLLLGVAVYFLWAMKAYYRQSWGKTFVKYCMLNFSYMIIFIIFFILTILVGIFVF
jgi:hypothetical protein